MKTTKAENAIHAFKLGLNCAQFVLTAYSTKLNFDNKLVLQISSGFGGGIGRLQETCGAVTGAFMVLGIYNSTKYPDNAENGNRTNTMIQSFSQQFKSIHGTLDCSLLLNCDINTEEGQRFFSANKLNETVCEKCVANSVKIINQLIRN